MTETLAGLASTGWLLKWHIVTLATVLACLFIAESVLLRGEAK